MNAMCPASNYERVLPDAAGTVVGHGLPARPSGQPFCLASHCRRGRSFAMRDGECRVTGHPRHGEIVAA